MIHDDHPFETPPEDRDPVRQFRGRLVAPVTIFTAGAEGKWAGLTVSSLMVSEGEAPVVVALVGETTDLWESMRDTGRFVVHVLADSDRDWGDVFAAIRPRPGGPFSGLDAGTSEWGPVLSLAANRLYCSLTEYTMLSFHVLIRAAIDRVEIGDLEHPALYFRGGYRRLDPG